MITVDKIVNKLSNGSNHGHPHADDDVNMCDPKAHKHDSNGVNIAPCIGCADDPIAELDSWQTKAAKEIEAENIRLENQTAVGSEDSTLNNKKGQNKDSASDIESISKIKIDTSDFVAAEEAVEKDKLQKMGLQTAIAIALHNFPEGLATFVAVLSEPKVGVILAIAIGIHNIPEWLCVSLPVYYATGNRWKAFWR